VGSCALSVIQVNCSLSAGSSSGVPQKCARLLLSAITVDVLKQHVGYSQLTTPIEVTGRVAQLRPARLLNQGPMKGRSACHCRHAYGGDRWEDCAAYDVLCCHSEIVIACVHPCIDRHRVDAPWWFQRRRTPAGAKRMHLQSRAHRGYTPCGCSVYRRLRSRTAPQDRHQ
jgi:hypothetical protein